MAGALTLLLGIVGFFVMGFYNDAKAAIVKVGEHEGKISTIEKLEAEMRELRIGQESIKSFLKDIKTQRCELARKGE